MSSKTTLITSNKTKYICVKDSTGNKGWSVGTWIQPDQSITPEHYFEVAGNPVLFEVAVAVNPLLSADRNNGTAMAIGYTTLSGYIHAPVALCNSDHVAIGAVSVFEHEGSIRVDGVKMRSTFNPDMDPYNGVLVAVYLPFELTTPVIVS